MRHRSTGPSAWNAFGSADLEGADYRTCATWEFGGKAELSPCGGGTQAPKVTAVLQ